MKTVIEMAREAGILATFNTLHPSIEIFAELVRADEREKYKWDVHSCGPTCKRYACVAMREAVEAEREACALLIEENAQECSGPMGLVLQANADAIRNRSNT
jgi:hypothetical protein